MKLVATPSTMTACDHSLTREVGIPSSLLMENAAEAVTNRALKALVNRTGTVLILAGAGNNGGDGIAVLRKLAMRGIPARLLLLGNAEKFRDAARLNYEIAKNASLPMLSATTEEELSLAWPEEVSVIVDALFGTGLCRALSGIHLTAVERANRSHAYRISVDIPSGVNGTDGSVLSNAFRANETVTFQLVKRGHLLSPGREYTGLLTVAPIAPMPYWLSSRFHDEWLERKDIERILPPRRRDSHKGTHGRALLIAGSEGFSGAARMAAHSALRMGTGLLRVAHPRGISGAFSDLPEAMTVVASDSPDWDKTSPGRIKNELEKMNAAAVGPGLGRGAYRKEILESALSWGGRLVVDADGLNALSTAPELFSLLTPNTVLTPHPAEMARLCGCTVEEVLRDSVSLARAKAVEWGCTVLLKGAVSIIASPWGAVTFNTIGNPGLAKGGSGDVLTGIVLALLSQGLSSYDAARLGSYLLGVGADKAVLSLSERSLLARDVIEALGVEK